MVIVHPQYINLQLWFYDYVCAVYAKHLRNEVDSWTVHGIMNTSGLLQIQGLHFNFARNPKYLWFHEPSKNWIYCLYLHFIIYLLYKKYF